MMLHFVYPVCHFQSSDAELTFVSRLNKQHRRVSSVLVLIFLAEVQEDIKIDLSSPTRPNSRQ